MVASLVTLKGQKGYPFGSEEDFAAMMTMRQEMVVSIPRNNFFFVGNAIKQMVISVPILNN